MLWLTVQTTFCNELLFIHPVAMDTHMNDITSFEGYWWFLLGVTWSSTQETICYRHYIGVSFSVPNFETPRAKDSLRDPVLLFSTTNDSQRTGGSWHDRVKPKSTHSRGTMFTSLTPSFFKGILTGVGTVLTLSFTRTTDFINLYMYSPF